MLSLIPPGADSHLQTPAVMASTWAMEIASGPGNRKVAELINVPSRIVLVRTARAASVVASIGHIRARGALSDVDVVVRAEEPAEAELLGALGDCKQAEMAFGAR